MRRYYIVILLVLVLVIAGWFLRPSAPPAREQAYVFERKAAIWNRLATVREPVASLRHGQRVDIIESKPWAGGEYARVLVADGTSGWMDSRQLIPAEIWQRAVSNFEKSKSMARQARGKTKVPTNLRVEPGRAAARFFQMGRDAPVEILARAVVERPKEESATAKKPEEQAGEQTASPRREDWLLVSTHDEDAGDLAGWVLGRFIEPDLPSPLRDYAAGIRFVAWFELNRVPASSKELSAEEKSETSEPPKQPPMMFQYLAAGVTGGEGQPCDFTLLRFYTWNSARRRYETAYIESNFCARFPIRVTPIPPGADPAKSEASFSFSAIGKSGDETRDYHMKQNVVRRLRARK